MRVFVRRTALTLADDEAVSVIMYFDDAAAIPPETHKPEFAMLSLPANALQPTELMPRLAPGWRETSKAQIAHSEAEQRIVAAFPDYSQRNSLAEMLAKITQYGAATDQWPAAAQKRKAEIDRAWAYVQAVRARASAMVKGALAADPHRRRSLADPHHALSARLNPDGRDQCARPAAGASRH